MDGFFKKIINGALADVAEGFGELVETMLDDLAQKQEEATKAANSKQGSSADPGMKLAPPADITDISKFGTTWQDVVRARYRPEEVENVQKYILTGEWPGGRWNPMCTPRVVAAVMIALDDNAQRARFSRISYTHGQERIPELGDVLRASRSLPEFRLTARDLDQLGATLGWSKRVLVDLLLEQADARPGGRNPELIEYVRDLGHVVQGNAETVRAGLTPATHNHRFIWQRLKDVDLTTLEWLSEQLCDAATADSSALRNAVRALYGQLGSDVRVAGLLSVLDRAKPKQRVEIIKAASDLPNGAARDGFIAHIQEQLKTDRSEKVRDAVALLHVERVASGRTDEPQPLRDLDLNGLRFSTIDLLAADKRVEPLLRTLNGDKGSRTSQITLETLLAEEHPVLDKFKPPHVAQLLFGASNNQPTTRRCMAMLKDSELRPTPLDFSIAARRRQGRSHSLIRDCAAINGLDNTFWTDEEVAVWAQHHLDELIESVSGFRRNKWVMGLIGRIDPQPRELQVALVESVIANGFDEFDVEKTINLGSARLVIPYLTSGKRKERANAARLVGDLQLDDAVPNLRLAAKNEKDTAAKGALVGALESLGQPVEDLLGRDELVAEATRVMNRSNAASKAIAWLDLGRLPAVSWSDGSAVDPNILEWFIHESVKARATEPTAQMRHHFAQMNRNEVELLGAFLMAEWLEQDAMEGATTSKGLLGVVAASGSPDGVESAAAYIRRHRRKRKNQSLAMVHVLGASDSPVAVRHLMDFAKQPRLKEIQHEAAAMAKRTARRKGWTTGDLVDRSVSSAGFTADGTQVFDFGERTFTATLNDDLTIGLQNNETGATVRALPRGRADEDSESIASSRRSLKTAKSELKSLAETEPLRLHEAMCAERTWNSEDFAKYFVEHPVVVRMASKLVWGSSTGRKQVLFRPLTDGTLITADDEEFRLPSNAKIALAHSHQANQEWTTHLADYEIAPLFAQFGRPLPVFGPRDRELSGFVKVAHSSQSLRSAIAGVGWSAGDMIYDLSRYYSMTIVRDFPTIGVKAVIKLSRGLVLNDASEESNIGFTHLSVVRSSAGRSGGEVRLSTLPLTLVSEIYHDAQTLAEAGRGNLG